MTSPLHAAYYADRAVQQRSEVISNKAIARDTFRIRLACPEIARRIAPGQFVMCRLAGENDPLLARPLALYDITRDSQGEPEAIDLVYLVVGRMTKRLAAVPPGAAIDLWGPLGNGFSPGQTEHLVMVAGGIGQTPFVAVAAEALGLRAYGPSARPPIKADRVTLCYGARSKDLLAGLDDFERTGVEVRLATDDGTAGHHGFVTDLLADLIAQQPEGIKILCCGPEPMMERVAKMAIAAEIPCQVSLETPMACGIGICFSCVAKVRQPDGQWDYKRTCVEGPIFSAEQIVW